MRPALHQQPTLRVAVSSEPDGRSSSRPNLEAGIGSTQDECGHSDSSSGGNFRTRPACRSSGLCSSCRCTSWVGLVHYTGGYNPGTTIYLVKHNTRITTNWAARGVLLFTANTPVHKVARLPRNVVIFSPWGREREIACYAKAGWPNREALA